MHGGHRSPNGVHDHSQMVSTATRGGYTQQRRQHRGGDDEGGGIRKADDDGPREQVDEHAETQQTQRQPEDADHQGQQNGIGKEVSGAGSCDLAYNRSTDQGYQGDGPGGQLPRGAEQSGHHRGQERGVEPIHRWKPC